MPNAESRNIAIVGHNGTGKTSLAEALLLAGGAIKRKGSIAEKNTVADFDPEEKERGGSIESAVLHLDHMERRINLIDCPGSPDFIGGVVEGLAAVELALITVNASAGIEVMTRKLWGMAEAREVARMLVLTKMDHERAKFDELIDQMKEVFGPSVTPLFLPIGIGTGFREVFNLLQDPKSAPAEVADQASDLAPGLIETIVSADEALMERYLNDEKIPAPELFRCFGKALACRAITPVLCVAAEKDLGVKPLLDVLASLTPAPTTLKRSLAKDGKQQVLEPREDGPFYAQVFKSKRDPFMGKISYLRVYSGTLASGATAKCGTGRDERISQFLEVQGKDSKEIAKVGPGAIFAVAKSEHLNSGTTLSVNGDGWLFPELPYPKPMFSRAVEAKNKKDDAKVSEQLRHLSENDPTFQVDVDSQTKELVVHAIGQLHLDLVLHRLKRIGIEVLTHPPKIPYRSTVAGTAEIRYRHKKQSGGSGQFGEVNIVLEPNPGKGYEFVDEIVGGVIPHNLIPSVDKGITKKLVEGVWPGIPIVDVRVRLNDGKTHPVDSKDIAFQIAGREAFRQAFEKARPVLIEPIVHLEVVVPSKYMGDITGHLSGKRGRIQGMDQMGDLQLIKAQVPSSEIQGYAGELKAITGGEGFYSMEFSHYDQVPSNLAGPVIEAAKKSRTEEEDA